MSKLIWDKNGDTVSNKIDNRLKKQRHSTLFFVTHLVGENYLLAFWSHSPWGHVHDMEQGWGLFQIRKWHSKGVFEVEEIDSLETKSCGVFCNSKGTWHKWVKNKVSPLGKMVRLDNGLKMSDC